MAPASGTSQGTSQGGSSTTNAYKSGSFQKQPSLFEKDFSSSDSKTTPVRDLSDGREVIHQEVTWARATIMRGQPINPPLSAPCCRLAD